MKLHVLLMGTCFWFSSCMAQSQVRSRVQVSNPAPRVGDLIDVMVYFDTLVHNEREYIDDTRNYFLKSNIAINTVATKIGRIWIGPFTFKINGRELTTDSVSIDVAEALVGDSNRFIIRQVSFEGDDYLVTEQVIISKDHIKREFAQLKEKEFEQLTLTQVYSSTHTGYRKFQIIVYKISKKKNYGGEAIIIKDDIENFPDNVTFTEYQIQ